MAAYPMTIHALNDFAVKAKLRTMNPTTGVIGPLTSGTVTAFLSTTNTAAATAADAALSMTPTHMGDGVWLIFFDAAVLTTALLDTHFASTPPYLIVQQTGELRAYALLSYVAARPAMVG